MEMLLKLIKLCKIMGHPSGAWQSVHRRAPARTYHQMAKCATQFYLYQGCRWRAQHAHTVSLARATPTTQYLALSALDAT